MQNAPGLYNGNISQMVTTIMKANNAIVSPQLTAYRYDQLNRITKMKTIWGDNISDIIFNNSWTGSLGDHYAETYRYDANGNIIHLTRNNYDGNGIDDLQYDYNVISPDLNPTLSELKNNQLAGLTQAPGLNGVNSTNYSYDEIGNLISDPNGPAHIDNIEWNVYGKIKSIKKPSENIIIDFIYDAMGNRVCKKLTHPDNNEITYQLYTRDAQGNIMANYTTAGGQTTLTEFDLYGSSRIGIKALDLLMQEPAPNLNPTYSRILGDKRYEISNHLGNVVTIFSDRKIAKDDEYDDGIIDNYKTYLVSSQDYTPFGMAMDGRGFNLDKYRFGFNGKEKDKETYGEGNEYDFGARIYNPRIGRWLALDPLQAKYPALSPYNFVGNNPIIAVDPNGKDIYIVIANSNSGKSEIQKENCDKIISRLAASQKGDEMIQKYINNPKEDIYITLGKVPSNSMGQTERFFDKDGNLGNPVRVDIGKRSHIIDETISPNFKYQQFDNNKKNYFITLDENEYGETQLSTALKEKEGAKVLGHELGAHIKDKDQTKVDEEHDAWGQKEYGKFNSKPGSEASKLNKEVDNPNKGVGKYEMKGGDRGKYKLEEKK